MSFSLKMLYRLYICDLVYVMETKDTEACKKKTHDWFRDIIINAQQ